MFCNKCGAENAAGNKCCSSCGIPFLNDYGKSDATDAADMVMLGGEPENKKSGKKLGIILGSVGGAMAVCAAAVVLLLLGPLRTPTVSELASNAMSAADANALNDAVAAYKDILEQDSENTDAYMGLWECYQELGKPATAMKWLQKGIDETGDRKLKECRDEYLEMERFEGIEPSSVPYEESYISYPDHTESSYDDAISNTESDIPVMESTNSDDFDESYNDREKQGKVLNIWCWNDEFKQRITRYYPDYVDNGDGTGKIGDVKVYWIINPNEFNGYQISLDEALRDQDFVASDDKIDIFLFESDYADKYVNSSDTLSMEEIGLTYDDTEDMYEYTRQVATDDNGELKGVSWQATPGVFAYKRSVAREVLGTDDPTAVQEYVSSWSRFEDTAAFMKDNGYRMLSSIDSSFRVFNTNKTTPWVDDDNTIIISDEALEWVRMQKDFFYNGYTNGYTVWSDGWIDDTTPYSNAFGFFLPTWGVNFTLKGYTGEEGYGDWAICEGPAPYYWGGTWLAASYQTDNKELVADIFRTMCSDDDIMEDIATEDNILDYTNNIDVMEELSYSDHYDSFLDGQNSFAVFHENALDVDLSCLTPYDSTLDQLFIDCMREYILGNMTFDDALDEFYEEAITYYPALSIPGVRPSCP